MTNNKVRWEQGGRIRVQGDSRSFDPSILYVDGWDYYEVSYTAIRAGRWPSGYSKPQREERVVRKTDEAGAKRFAKTWGLHCPPRTHPGGR